MTFNSPLVSAIRRDRLVVIGALFTVVALSWAYLVDGAGMGMSGLEMTRMSQLELSGGMSAMSMMTPAVWTPGYALLMFVMWWVMMVAMMLPGAAPLILLFATINRKQLDSGRPHVGTGVFVIGYLAAWGGFSLLGTILQWTFERTGVLSPTLVGANTLFSGTLLLTAGIYQFTPIKQACLSHCRSPLAFMSTQYRPGIRGALQMGLVHGVFCVGCCWFLMGLMFFGGLMNLYWIAGLSMVVLLEKTVPASHWFGHVTGIALLVWGVKVLIPVF